MSKPRNRLWVLQAWVLLGALLTFTLEPLVGRLLLPAYGGGVHIWATCLMVYQGLLFCGYAWAHGVARHVGPWHLVVVLLALPFLPLHVVANPDPAAPITTLVRDLALSIGLPFFALASTSVVAQHWLACSDSAWRDQPWVLYAISNIGSIVGLLAYPTLIEPFMGLALQRVVWTVTFAFWVALALAAANAFPAVRFIRGESADVPVPGIGLHVYWVALAAAPSAFLTAVTNVVASDAGSMPLTWVIPLLIYLSTFILIFGRKPWMPLIFDKYWPHVALLGVFYFSGARLGGAWAIALVHLTCLFVVCMAAHGALYRSKPHAAHLTRFYLAMSLGGWVGGAAVAVVAPMLLQSYAEYPLSLLFLGVVLAGWNRQRLWQHLREEDRLMLGASALFAVVVGVRLQQLEADEGHVLETDRTFYGVYRVWEDREVEPPVRYISHGTTKHGMQVLDGGFPIPAGYYHPKSPQADVVLRPEVRRVGLVGLGAGAMATLFPAGVEVTYYEIDPAQERLAREHFDYLEQSHADVDVIIGDARLSLQHEPDARFDLLVVDAFSSDAIPTHLLTVEALQLYRSKLEPGGWLLFHVSNRYYDLRRVLATTGAEVGMHSLTRTRLDDLAPREWGSSWYVMHENPEHLDVLRQKGWHPPIGATVRPWTDDHANVLAVMKMD